MGSKIIIPLKSVIFVPILIGIELKSSVDEQFALIAQHLKSVKKEIEQFFKTHHFNLRKNSVVPRVDKQIHYINNQEALLVRADLTMCLKVPSLDAATVDFYVVPESLLRLFLAGVN